MSFNFAVVTSGLEEAGYKEGEVVVVAGQKVLPSRKPDADEFDCRVHFFVVKLSDFDTSVTKSVPLMVDGKYLAFVTVEAVIAEYMAVVDEYAEKYKEVADYADHLTSS